MYGGSLLSGLALLAELASATDYGTFSDPANNARMKFRYWLPDASVDIATVQSDIAAAGALGAGGVEFLPLYNYGGSLAGPPEGADWAKYGFGTPAFNEIFKASLKTVKNAGMRMDFALGPNQGQGVPAETTDNGLHWDLAPFNATIPTNGSYQGPIPGWGTGELVALVSAKVLSSSVITNPASSLFSTAANNATRLVLAVDSLRLHTDEVNEDGTVSLSFNSTKHEKHHLFAYYQYQDLVKNLDIQNHTTGTIFDNGSYTVDHFSARGAETIINFWETYILNDTTIKTLLGEVGTYGWEDSIEIKSNISWTPTLPTKFESLNGYKIHKFLPLLMYANNNPGVQPSYPGDLECVLNTEDEGAGYVNDFRAALAQGYGDYLRTLTTWLEGLGLGYSAQISYNLPLDMQTNIDRVTAPECESLAFNDKIDGYRQFSGAANLAQKAVISNEMGADLEQALALPLAQLLNQINTAFSGGVNQIVLHGQTYTGDYFQTTWPGYLAFFLLFADSYMDKQPSWLWGLPDAIGYINRNQFVLHQGEPRIDVAFYNKVSYTDTQLATLYQEGDLIEAGFTYNYLNPTNLNLSQAYVSGKLLAPKSPAYQAIVVPSFENMTLDALSAIQGFADSGLPVILGKDLPGYYPDGNTSDKQAVLAALQTLKNSTNVHRAADGQIASKLRSLHIRPRVETVLANNTIWYPVMRSDNSTDYVYVFSKDTAGTGYLVVNSTKTPYSFNSWTGDRVPLLDYRVEGNTTKIPLTLAINQTAVFAFSNEWKSDVDTPSVHATQIPSNVLGCNYTTAGGLAVHATKGASGSSHLLKLSNGKTYDITTNASTSPVTLGNWTLTAEHWQAPRNMSDATVIADKHNTTHHLTSLISWLDIPGLHNASGLGYYSNQFSWPPSHHSDVSGAYLSLPAISHGLKLFVNGQAVQTLDFANPLVDISSFLHRGSNNITAIVPTLMWNYIRSIYDEILISGNKPDLATLPNNVDTGLIGDVKVLPYTNFHFSI
ncbi:uncharacterized protein N7483_008129 [Penicillium malachiteum]|uniref:uncharacterized protein n=1 Tax=Penicillium malachiteum TaxID=1324776 RepID=UPI002547003F|nr:uncharacterized protein N7483_008129 [Penicillium malachiteum]KAJ5726772.1 hypothetical protein N7483_008129 [Penicillium malachiteum]